MSGGSGGIALRPPAAPMPRGPVLRLNWGSGPVGEPGWINSDLKEGPGVHFPCDILAGLPLADGSVDCCVSIHALPELAYPDVVPALRELRRVLRPGGVLRLALPDLERALEAYRSGRREYFLVPDEEVRSLGGKLIVHLLWFGYSRTLFTVDFIEELLLEAGYREVARCAYRQTAWGDPEIVALDNRPDESLFVEALA